MPDRITVTADELNSPQVDARLHQVELAERAASRATLPQPPETRVLSWLLHALAYMSAAGLAGGLLAFFVSETIQQAVPTYGDGYRDFAEQYIVLVEAFHAGDMPFEEAVARRTELFERYQANPFAREIIAAEDNPESITEEQLAKRLEAVQQRDRVHSWIKNMLWFMVVGLVISGALAIAESAVGRNWRGVVVHGSVGLATGLLGGILVGTFIDSLYDALQRMGGDDPTQISLVWRIFARSVGWMILGGFLALGPGIAMRSEKKLLIGLVGGLVGGLMGGFLFDPVSYVSIDVISRGIGITAIGLFTGLGVGFIENAAKTGWLKVTSGLIAGKQFILYHRNTRIGSSPQCEIYLFKDVEISPFHAQIIRAPSGFVIKDLNSAAGVVVNGSRVKQTQLRNGDEILIANTTFTFGERTKRST